MRNSSLNIVPEHNRAQIYRQWFQLAKTPFVLPNKTTVLFEKLKELNVEKYDTEKATNISEKIKEHANGRRVVLYQGGISEIRQIDKAVIAVKKMHDKFFFVFEIPVNFSIHYIPVKNPVNTIKSIWF